jgi:hypothetical protein
MDTKELKNPTAQIPPEPMDVSLDEGNMEHLCDADPTLPSAAKGSGLILATDSSALAGLVQRTRQTIDDAVPANTRRAYEGDLRRFAAWCSSAGLVAMPAAPGTIAVYLRHLADAGRKVSTIERGLAAICVAHTRAGHTSPWKHPLVADMLKGLRRELGTRPYKKKAADDDILRRMLGVLPSNMMGLRDRALLTLGWCAAFRRSEVVAVDVEDRTPAPKGLVVLVRASKTDQTRQGEEVPIFFSNSAETCPVRSLEAWLPPQASRRVRSSGDSAGNRSLGQGSPRRPCGIA